MTMSAQKMSLEPFSTVCPACGSRHDRIEYTDPLVCEGCELWLPRAIVSAAELGKREYEPITVAKVWVRLSDGLVVGFYACRLVGDWIEFYGQQVDSPSIRAHAVKVASIVAVEWKYETDLSIDDLRVRGWLDLP